MQLQKQSVKNQTLKLLDYLSSQKVFREFHLVGGTALALYLGHRISIDLDFFSPNEFKSNLIENLNKDYKTVHLNDNSIELFTENTKVMFMYFAFPRYKPLKKLEGIRMADPIDIGLMKLLALQGRSTRKDIIDLFFIDREIISLPELLNIFDFHYPKEKFSTYSSLKKLLNFNEIEKEPMPRMLKDEKWENIRKVVEDRLLEYFERKIKSS